VPSSPVYAERLASLGHVGPVCPVDDVLGISHLPFKMTLPVMLEIAHESVTCESYEQAQQKLMRGFSIKTNDDSMRKVTNYIGTHVFNNDLRLANQIKDELDHGRLQFPKDKKNDILYMEVDGASLHTRQDDSKGNITKENKLGMVFSTDNIRWWLDKHGTRKHEILKREYSSYIGDSEEFSKLFFSTAIRNGYGRYNKTILLSDGATWIRTMKELYYPDAQQILDFFHLKKHIYEFAEQLFNKDQDKSSTWTNEICSIFKHDSALEAIKQIKKASNASVKSHLDSLLLYLDNNKSNIDYVSYLKEGYFIGSGAIESSNKTVLIRRMKFGPMRWHLQSAQAVVTLLAKYRSGLWMTDVAKPTYEKFGEPFNGYKMLKI
jgi:hypothetical protein